MRISMRTSVVVRALGVMFAALGAGCRPHPAEGSAPLAARTAGCAGKATLEISNSTRTTVEIVEMTGTTRTVVALVSPGVQTIAIPPYGTHYGVRLAGEEAFIGWENSTQANPSNRFRRGCDVG